MPPDSTATAGSWPASLACSRKPATLTARKRRRLVTRVIAILPAVVVTIYAGEKATGQLLILSQVVLSLQLPFAVVPLVLFTASRTKMGPYVAPRWLTLLAVSIAAAIIVLNAKLVFDFVSGS